MKEFILDVKIPKKSCMFKIDKSLFSRLYDNLLQNSFKYNTKNTKILFEIVEEKNRILIVIADNGKGISKDIRNIIFDPFVTENEARTLGKWTGMGLSIVKRIVELHGGTIKLSEDPQEGYITEFNIELPKA